MTAALFTARRFGESGTLYKSRVTGREYLVEKKEDAVSVHHNGRCVYFGQSLARAFGIIELEDCI